jgi:zinc protease
MGGGSTPQDLETMFQLLYLRFTEPRADQNAFAAMAEQARAMFANQVANPEVAFNQTIDAIMSRSSPRRLPQTTATVDQWDLAKSLAFYKARFADASQFTFVFTGSFTPDVIKPFVETYIASLPATHGHETFRDLGIEPPTGVIEKTVERGIAPKSEVAIVFSGPVEYDDAHLLALRTMGMLLQSRLFDTIRQELGGTYSITVNSDAERVPRPEYTVRIEWTCDPARTATLVQRVFDEIGFVKSTRLGPEQMALIRTSLARDHERNAQDNAYLLNQIARRYEDGDGSDVAAVEHETEQIAALTGDEIQQAARTYLNLTNYVKVTLMPEGK